MFEDTRGDCELYEKIVIWAEEGATVSGNQQEWSFGNASTGQNGIPLIEDWEIYGMSFHADVFPAGRVVTVAARNNAIPADIPGALIACSGPVNNAVATVVFPTAIPVPAGAVISFRTVTVTGGGGVSDARVAAWLRRKPK